MADVETPEEPTVLPYVGFRDSKPAEPPKLPARAVRFSMICAALTVGVFLIACPFVQWGLPLYAVPVTLLLAVSSVVAAIFAIIRNHNLGLLEEDRLAPRRVWRTLFGSIALLIAVAANALQTAGHFRGMVISTVSTANLRGLHQAALIYQEEEDVTAPTLPALLAQGQITLKMLYSPADPVYMTGVPSYVYMPVPEELGNDPAVLFAYEAQPFSRTGHHLWPTAVHAAIFADGRTALLTPSELTAALATDAAHRTRAAPAAENAP